jgi:hypothetical protein
LTFKPLLAVDTPAAVAAFARQFPGINARGWLAFARQTPLRRPPLLARLPPAVPWELTSVHEDFRRERNAAELAMPAEAALESIERLRGRLLAAAEGLPEDYLEAAAMIVAEGRAALAATSRRSARKIPYLGLANVAVGSVLQLPELLGHAFYTYLNRRDRALAAYIERSFCRLVLFGPDQQRNRALVGALSAFPPGSFQLFTRIEEAVEGELLRRRDQVFQPLLQEFLGAAKDALRVLRDPGANARSLSVFKQRVFHAFNAAGAACGSVGARLPDARRDLDRTLAWAEGRLGPEALQQARSRIDNFLEKLTQFDRFFTQRFCLRELAVVRGAIDRIHGRAANRWEVVPARLTVTKVIWLQPAKDYLEYRKGMVSGDCSSGGALAAAHLRHPRFFNLRMFVGPSVLDWRGNIYCLDFSDGPEPAVVVDRVQIDRSEELVPLEFFPSLRTVLCDRLFAGLGLKVLAPSKISNYARLQASFQRYLADAKPSLEALAFGPQDRAFECSGEAQLYRLG